MLRRLICLSIFCVRFICRSQSLDEILEKAEVDLMNLIMEDQDKRGRSIITYDAADDFSRFIKILHKTRTLAEFDNIWVPAIDEARSELYASIRKSAFYFHVALSAAVDEEAALKAEKSRAENEQARGMRMLIAVNDQMTSLEKKAEILIMEDKKKLAERLQRAKNEHIIARIKLDGLRYDCARTSLSCTCRWLGNFKKRVLEAEMFENLTTASYQTISNSSTKDSANNLAHFKDIAADPLKIQKTIEKYNTVIPILTKKLGLVEPKTKLLRDIDTSFQTFLRRDDSQIYSQNQSVADLELLLHRVKNFFARFVSKHRIARFAPPQMISQIGDDQIVQLSRQFGKVFNELDFETMLDYDEYSRDGTRITDKNKVFSMRLEEEEDL
uniref:Uncharacterized protein n=2 Tax=Plectus sambesii TaxID=2011161 RepID=A0A914V0V7_9BILA